MNPFFNRVQDLVQARLNRFQDLYENNDLTQYENLTIQNSNLEEATFNARANSDSLRNQRNIIIVLLIGYYFYVR